MSGRFVRWVQRGSWVLLSALVAWPTASGAAVVEYRLVVEQAHIGQRDSLTINGRSPAPTITARVGDQLHIRVVNHLDDPVLLHWHGLLLPYDQDGVPDISSPPIAPGDSRDFRFVARQSGSYWYHSHVDFQEQDGLYGAIVLHGDEQAFPDMARCAEDRAVVLSDWDQAAGVSILRRLKKDGDWFAAKKGTRQHWRGTLARGSQAVASRLRMSLNRMGAMDVSDVGYDRFLANGEPRHIIAGLGSGCVRLRVINAAASSIFDLEYAAGPLEIISTDGQPVVPLRVPRLRIGMGETYDLLLPTAAAEARELRATVNDGSGWSSVLLGDGQLRAVPTRERADPYMTMDHSGAAMDHAAPLYPYRKLRARTARTAAERRAPDRVISMRLTGDMENYVWSFNGLSLSEAPVLSFVPGELLRIDLINTTMMEHPIHLHGHFFRVLNGQGDYAPLKHTLSMAALQTQSIEVLAVEPGRWLMHCHNLYHMMAGMARAVRYQAPAEGSVQQVVAAFPPTPGGADQLPAVRRARAELGDDIARRAAALERVAGPMPAALERAHPQTWWRGEWALLSNLVEIEGQLRGDRNQLEWALEHGLVKRSNGRRNSEASLGYRRRLGRFAAAYVGYQVELEHAVGGGVGDEFTHSALLGAALRLPLQLELELEWDSADGVIARLGNSHQLGERLSLRWQLDVGDDDDRAELHYQFSQRFRAAVHYSARYGFGGGIRLLL